MISEEHSRVTWTGRNAGAGALGHRFDNALSKQVTGLQVYYCE